MNEAMTSEKHAIKIMADIEEDFDSFWRKRAIYKLYKVGITNNLLLAVTSFMKNYQNRNLVNTHIESWCPYNFWSTTKVHA